MGYGYTSHDYGYDQDPEVEGDSTPNDFEYDEAKEWLKDLIHQVYNTGDIDDIERSLEEVACKFELNLPAKEPKIRRGR